jgi:protein O-mannosyl-transferase
MSQRKIKKLRAVEKVGVGSGEVEMENKHSIAEILKNNWVFMVLISVGIILLYINALKGDFVSDDYATILNNSDIHSISYLFNNFTPVVLVNFVIGNVFGVVPVAYHLFSVLLYILTCWVALIFLNFITTENVTRIAIMIFAVMPIHVEAVSWISGKPYLFIAFFVLFSVIAFIKYLEDDKVRYLLYAAGSFLLAILADPPRPFSWFFVVGLYLIVINRPIYWQKTKKLIPYIMGLLVVVVLIKLPMITGRVNVVNSGYNASDSIFYDPFFQYPTGIPKYLQLIFFPFDLTLYHTMYVLPVWLNWLVMLVFLGLISYTFFKHKGIFFAVVFFLVTLLPSMAPIKVSWLVAERYGYLPSLGMALFAGIVLNDIWERKKYVAMGILGCWCGLFTVRTFLRNIDWQTNHKLWVNTCQVSPNSHNAWNNIGDDYDKLATAATSKEEKDWQYENSIKGFTQSTIIKPNYADAYHNRANIFYKIGRLDLARDSYNTALYYSPGLYQTYLSLTQIDLMEGKLQLALEHAIKAVQASPNDPQSAYVLAVVYAQGGELQKAEEILTNIIKMYPQYTLATDTLKQVKALMVTTK